MKISLEWMQAVDEDLKQLMGWRQDPLARRMSANGHIKTFTHFAKDFVKRFFTYPCWGPFFLLKGGKRVGYVAFESICDPQNQGRLSLEISFVLDPQQRGKGLSYFCLQCVCDKMRQMGVDVLVANIKQENIASKKAFQKLGFTPLEKISKKNENGKEKVSLERYIFPLSKKNSQVKIIAEAGSNWRMGSFSRDLSMAKALIDAAKESGCQAIKFQVFRAKKTYVENAGVADYLSEKGIDQEVSSLFRDLEMPYEMLPMLYEECQKRSIEFMATAFSLSDLQKIDPFVDCHKVASYELGHVRLLQELAKIKKPLLISTGAATYDEIEWALQTLQKQASGPVTLMQCVAQYPAMLDNCNVRVLEDFRRRFQLPLGLSDHSCHPTLAPVCAVALGASVIEKHFTLDKRLPGPDHAFAVTPKEMKELVQNVQGALKTLGEPIKKVCCDEKPLRSFACRSVQATSSIQEGEALLEGVNVDILRSGKQEKGVHPRYLVDIEGKRARRDIPCGAGIQMGDW